MQRLGRPEDDEDEDEDDSDEEDDYDEEEQSGSTGLFSVPPSPLPLAQYARRHAALRSPHRTRSRRR